MIDLRQLRQIVAVAEELHFGRAAQRLNMSQPPLSFGIRQLEERLGVLLFHRTKKSVKITAAGQVLLDHAYTILALVDEAQEDVRKTGRGTAGSIRIGYTDEFGASPLAWCVSEFRRLNADVYIDLLHFYSDELETKVREGQLDVAFVNLPITDRAPKLEVIPLGSRQIGVVVAHDHPFAAKKSIRLEDLRGQAVMGAQAMSARASEQHIASLSEAAMALPLVEYHNADIDMTVSLAREGLGVLITPDGSTALKRPDIVFRPLDDPNAWIEQGAIHRGLQDSPATARFLSLVQTAFEQERSAR